jgi:hypothetical protein
MIANIGPAEHLNILDKDRQSQSVRLVFVALGYRTRTIIRAMSERWERRIATFAGVPYHDPLLLQQWEQLWETGPWLSQETRSLYRRVRRQQLGHNP